MIEKLVCPNVGSCVAYELLVSRSIMKKRPDIIQKDRNGTYFCYMLRVYQEAVRPNCSLDCLNLKLLNDHRNDMRLQA